MSQSSKPNAIFYLARALARLAFALSPRDIRLLRSERMAGSGMAILAASRPTGLLDAVKLIAAFNRPLRCVIDPAQSQGALRGFVARLFGMMPLPRGEDGFRRFLDSALAAIESGEALILLADAATPASDSRALRAARLALEAEAKLAGPVEVYPVDLLLPSSRAPSREQVIYLGAPLVAREYLARYPGDTAQAARALAQHLDPAALARSNAFALPRPTLTRLLSDLQETLREELADRWANAAEWKQNPTDFRLSGAAREWAEAMNASNPGRLLALSARVREYREQYRQWTLARYESQHAGPWTASRARRMLSWTEIFLGFLPSFYGAVNHSVLAAAFRIAGLHRHQPLRDRTAEWILRAIVVLIAYGGQTLMVNFFFGRAVAGYYALSLPLSGAYLWRYVWLLRHRARLLWQDIIAKPRLERIRRARSEVADRLHHELAALAA